MDGLIQSREILLLSLLAFCQRSASTQEKLWTGLTRKESKCVKSFNEWRKDYIYVTLRIWIRSMFPFLNIHSFTPSSSGASLEWYSQGLSNPVLVFFSNLVSMLCPQFPWLRCLFFWPHSTVYIWVAFPQVCVAHLPVFSLQCLSFYCLYFKLSQKVPNSQ